jgi:predicted regulator of Ras-like GTPase activity (Roadblock/LC7/MglB family)
MKDILRQLNETISARGALVVARDGMLVAADVRDGTDVDRLAALGAVIVTGVGQSLRASGMNGFTHVEVAAEHGKIVLAEAGPTYLLVLIGARLEIGPGSLEIRSAAQRVAKAAHLIQK